jgi:hypothetical protein
VVTQRATGVAALRDEVRRLVDRAAQLGVDAAALAALVESTAESGSAVDGRPGIGDGAAQVAPPVPPVRPAEEHAA